MTPQQAREWLEAHGYIKLPPGSYFAWIQKDRFEMYKSCLSRQYNGSWIPKLSKLAELSQLDEGYKKADWKEFGAEKHAKEEIESLTQSEMQIS